MESFVKRKSGESGLDLTKKWPKRARRAGCANPNTAGGEGSQARLTVQGNSQVLGQTPELFIYMYLDECIKYARSYQR